MDETDRTDGKPDREPENVVPDEGEDPRLLELALRVADEAVVDWDAERRSAPDLSESLERMRELESLCGARRQAELDESPEQRPALFQWGPLRALELLGRGGYGEVYVAWDPALHRLVALKLRREDRGPRSDRWLDEARRLARIRHPHVLTVHGAETHGGRSGLWCDLLRGRTLEELLEDVGPMSATEATLIGIDLCAALAAVHAAGLVHGDVKARNIMRVGARRPSAAGATFEETTADGAGNLVLMDFGAAQELTPKAASITSSAGTPLYAAPELLHGGRPSVTSDIYAVGVLLFRLVSGRFPVEADSLEELARKLQSGAAMSLRTLRPDLSSPFVEVVERATAADPALRFRDAAALERALRGVLGVTSRMPAARSDRWRVVRAALAGAAAVALVWSGVDWLPVAFHPRFRVAPTHPFVAVTLNKTVEGRASGEKLGQTVAGLGDVDGDGVPDYAIGSPGANQSTGMVTIYSGAGGGTPILNLKGAQKAEEFGFNIAPLGDINGDSHPDFAITALSGDGLEPGSGTLSIYLGGPGLGSKPAFVLQGRVSHSDFGYSVAGGLDLNRDGYADILVGAPVEMSNGHSSGAVYLYLGGAVLSAIPHLVLTPSSLDSQFGISVAGLGDFNDDGFNDFAVGANWDSSDGRRAGRAYVYYGGAGLHDQPDLTVHSPDPGAWFGKVCGPGDLNNDGFPDLAVGAWFGQGYAPFSGTVSIYDGGQHPSAVPSLILRGEASDGDFGSVLAGLGDVNGDGIADLAVGAPRADLPQSQCGAVYVYFGGKPMDAVADVRIAGKEAYDGTGMGLAGLDDLDGDGLRDLLIGAPSSFGSMETGGRALIYTFSRFTFTHPAAGEIYHAGSPVLITWNGAEKANLDYSSSAGQTWVSVARGLGGAPENRFVWTAPKDLTAEVRLRLTPATKGISGSANGPSFQILHE